jgi:hypothetical protein
LHGQSSNLNEKIEHDQTEMGEHSRGWHLAWHFSGKHDDSYVNANGERTLENLGMAGRDNVAVVALVRRPQSARCMSGGVGFETSSAEGAGRRPGCKFDTTRLRWGERSHDRQLAWPFARKTDDKHENANGEIFLGCFIGEIWILPLDTTCIFRDDLC